MSKDPTLDALKHLATQKGALLDAFQQIDRLKERVDSLYLRIRKMEEAIRDSTLPPATDAPAVPEELSLTLRLNIHPEIDGQLDSLLAAVAAAVTPRGGYEHGDGVEDGAQHVAMQWWRPEHGCDSLDRTLDVIRTRLIAAVEKWYQGALAAAPATDEPAVPPVVGEVVNRLGWIAAQFKNNCWSDDSATVTHAAHLLQQLAAELAELRSRATPAPVEGEVGELVEFLTPTREQVAVISFDAFLKLRRAATLLQQQSTELASWRSRAALLPVPVGERLPGAADCDALGRCWWLGALKEEDSSTYTDWALLDCPCDSDTHWLPHWAIAQPSQEGEEVEG